MNGDVDSVFLDTNVLVYANVSESPLHQVALNTIQTYYDAGAELWISWQILREFMAVLTRPQAFASPRPVSTIIERVRFFETHFSIAEDRSLVMERLLTLMEQIPIGGSQVHDANIVATMQVHGIRHLLTHNISDFDRFSGVIMVLPLESAPYEAN